MPRPNPNTELIKSVAAKQLDQALQISALQNEVSDIRNDVKEVLFYLRSDPKTNTKGLVEQVGINTMFRQDLKSKVTILGVVGGMLSGVLFWILGLIFKA
jgi:uncharacterized protein (UPF0335 family)